jgi:hypothetical protein
MIVTIFSDRSYSVAAVGQAGAGLVGQGNCCCAPEPTTPSSPRQPLDSSPTGATACRGLRGTAYSMVPDAKQVTPCCRHQHVPLRDLHLRGTGLPRLPSAPQRHLPSNLPPGRLPHGQGWNPCRPLVMLSATEIGAASTNGHWMLVDGLVLPGPCWRRPPP